MMPHHSLDFYTYFYARCYLTNYTRKSLLAYMFQTLFQDIFHRVLLHSLHTAFYLLPMHSDSAQLPHSKRIPRSQKYAIGMYGKCIKSIAKKLLGGFYRGKRCTNQSVKRYSLIQSTTAYGTGNESYFRFLKCILSTNVL